MKKQRTEIEIIKVEFSGRHGPNRRPNGRYVL